MICLSVIFFIYGYDNYNEIVKTIKLPSLSLAIKIAMIKKLITIIKHRLESRHKP